MIETILALLSRFYNWMTDWNLEPTKASVIPAIRKKGEPIFFYIGYLQYLDELSGAIMSAQCAEADKVSLEARNKKLYDLNESLRVKNNKAEADKVSLEARNKSLYGLRESLRVENNKLTELYSNAESQLNSLRSILSQYQNDLTSERFEKKVLSDEVDRLKILLDKELALVGDPHG